MSESAIPPSDEALIRAAARQVEALRARRTPASALDAGSSTAGILEQRSFTGYELIAERHRGGQGVVYEALQQATKRKVALKVLYDHASNSDISRRRFELEVEILSQLRHPNIVTVHDSGQARGQFFYVMDLVAGVPLDRWIESRRAERAGLGRGEMEEIVRLFIKICDAVNAAHLRGVIHRDLKPGNLLVDGAGEPHVLDFGLAKFSYGMPSDPASMASMTQTGQFVGSLPWSSPEQVVTGDVDMRSDVYALGVLLYHALTGQFPYRVVGSPAEVVEQIRSAEPADMNAARRPLGDGSPGGVAAEIDGELDTIVRMCLQKDRQRRYQTAGDLGRDLQRYLEHEPVQAKRDSFGYLLRKQIRRHRLLVASGAAVLTALAIGLTASLYYWRQAEAKRVEAQAESERARHAEQVANTKRAEADSVVKLLEGLFGSSDAFQFPGPMATIKQLVDGYSATLFQGLEQQPEVELRMRNTIGNAYYNMAEFDQAEKQYTRAVALAKAVHGENSPQVSQFLGAVATVHLTVGAPDKAEQFYRAALKVDEATRSDPDCLEADSLLGLGAALADQQHLAEAEKTLQQSITIYRARPEDKQQGLPEAMGKLAKVLLSTSRADEAEPLLNQALEYTEKHFGVADPRTATARSDLAKLYFQTNRARAAATLYETAAASDAKFFGERDPRRAIELSNQAIVLKSLGELDKAEALQREALSIRREKLPADHPYISLSLEGIGTILEARKNYAAAQPLYDEAAEIQEKRGTLDDDVVRNRLNRGRIRFVQENYVDAAVIYAQLEKTLSEQAPPDYPDLLNVRQRLALTWLKLHEYAKAEPLLRAALERTKAGPAAPTWQMFNLMSALGEALVGLDRWSEGGELLKTAADGLLATANAPLDRQREAVERMVHVCEHSNDAAGAAEWRAKMPAAN